MPKQKNAAKGQKKPFSDDDEPDVQDVMDQDQRDAKVKDNDRKTIRKTVRGHKRTPQRPLMAM